MSKAKQAGMPEKAKVYGYPSRFGTHSTMVDEEKTKELNDPRRVVCADEHGTYITEKNRVDSKMADPNRYTTSRIGKLFAGHAEK